MEKKLKNLCRICLIKQFEYLIDLFIPLENSIRINEILVECTSVDASKEDNLPPFICKKCLEKLQEFYQFRRLAQQTDEYLKKILITKDSNEEIKIEYEDGLSTNDNYEYDVLNKCVNEKIVKNDNKPMICNLCLKVFSSYINLRTHDRIVHKKERNHVCGGCKKTFVFRRDLKRHKCKNKHFQNVENETNEEHKISEEIDKDKYTEIMKNGCKKYKCNICAKISPSRSVFKSHILIHNSDRPFKCDVCSKSFKQKVNLKSHKMFVHYREERFCCSYCDKKFVFNRDLKRHLLFKHNDISTQENMNEIKNQQTDTDVMAITTAGNISCEISNGEIVSTGKLDKHCEKKEQVQKLICKYCEKLFASMFSLEKHLRIHTGERPYECDICLKSFAQKENLKSHLVIVHLKKYRYKCTICPKGFFYFRDLRKHYSISEHDSKASNISNMDEIKKGQRICSKIMIDNDDDQVVGSSVVKLLPTCNLCGLQVNDKVTLKSHLKTHISEYKHECNICNEKFLQKYHIALHKKAKHGFLRYVCEDCTKSFKTSCSLKKHQVTHTGEKNYVCDKCGATFAQRENLNVHEKCVHLKERRYACDKCDKKFFARRSLVRHYEFYHTAKPELDPDPLTGLYKCYICLEIFELRGSLKNHLWLHRTDLNFKCEICSKRFREKRQLNIHVTAIHERIKRYKCEICDKSFAHRSNIVLHRRRHLNLTNFKCQLCNRALINQKDLDEHMRRHTGERPFCCTICNKSYVTLKNLNEHTKKHKRNETRGLFMCLICKILFLNQQLLNKHQQTTHNTTAAA